MLAGDDVPSSNTLSGHVEQHDQTVYLSWEHRLQLEPSEQASSRTQALLDNTDRNHKHIVMCDKEMYLVTPQITLNTTRPKSPQ